MLTRKNPLHKMVEAGEHLRCSTRPLTRPRASTRGKAAQMIAYRPVAGNTTHSQANQLKKLSG